MPDLTGPGTLRLGGPLHRDAVGPIEGLLSISVVVMAETRQQAIEKASAGLSAKLPEVLGQVFPDDDDRRFAQLGPDILDDRDILDHMEEVPMR